MLQCRRGLQCRKYHCMSVAHVVTRTYLPGITPRIGRSRDVYELEGALLFVETDRINAYNWLIPTGIPNKGRCLHQLSAFWFEKLDKPNHMITADINMIPLPEHAKWDMFAGRSMFVRKCKVIPILCIVREYLTGTGWLEYQTTGSISGQMLPSGLKENDKLPEPIFTPSIEVKRTQGTVSKNVTMEYIAAEVGNVFAASILEQSLEIFKRASEYALTKGLILADTKLEFGVVEKKLVLGRVYTNFSV